MTLKDIFKNEETRKAKERLKGNWETILLVSLIYYIPIRIVSSGLYNIYLHLCLHVNETSINSIALLLLVSPIIYGANKYFMGFIRDERVSVRDIISSYNDFSRIIIATLLKNSFTFLWALLFIIPGVVKAYSYSMMYNIMNDNPEMTGSEALKLSKKIMSGHRKDLFMLYMATIGWAVVLLFILALVLFILIFIMSSNLPIMVTFIILTIISVIIALLVFIIIIRLNPLYIISKSYFYEEVRKRYTHNTETY
jgi:Predicted integral membrane protein